LLRFAAWFGSRKSRNTAKKSAVGRVRPMVIDSGMMPPLRTRPSTSRPDEQARDIGALMPSRLIQPAGWLSGVNN